MAYAYEAHKTKYTESNAKSYGQRQICFLYIEMLALDTTKLKWIETKLYKKRINHIDQMFNLVDQR